MGMYLSGAINASALITRAIIKITSPAMSEFTKTVPKATSLIKLILFSSPLPLKIGTSLFIPLIAPK